MLVGNVNASISDPVCNILESDLVPWIYNKELTEKGPGNNWYVGNTDPFQFTHDILKDNGYKSPFADALISELLRVIMKDNSEFFENFEKILRVKANLLTKSTSPDHHALHVDSLDKHFVILYYVNESDGDTYLFHNKDFVERIKPEKGKYIIFDGSTFHASSSPTTHDTRIVINFNVVINTI